MRKIIFILLAAFTITVSAIAQGHDKRLSRKDYTRQLELFIIREAQFNAKEADEFLKIFKEMQQKQRKVFEAMKFVGKKYPQDESACAEAIRKKDKMDIELKTLQQHYHNKLLKVLPACKVLKAIKAEDRFHRQMLKKWSHGK